MTYSRAALAGRTEDQIDDILREAKETGSTVEFIDGQLVITPPSIH